MADIMYIVGMLLSYIPEWLALCMRSGLAGLLCRYEDIRWYVQVAVLSMRSAQLVFMGLFGQGSVCRYRFIRHVSGEAGQFYNHDDSEHIR